MTSASRSPSRSSQASLFDAPPDTQPEPSIESLEAQFDALPAAWRTHLRPFIDSDAYAPLCRFVDDERAAGKTIYPADVFRALRLTSPDDVKVVILGQDPYHGEDRGHPQAHGLAFSVPPSVRPPPSLRNIFKEIAANFGYDTPGHGCLDAWAKQGVLLDDKPHCVLEAPHPSPLSAHRGFLGCRHFVLANEYLETTGRKTIDWRLPNAPEIVTSQA
jgi:uracil-DNA glycosylase